MSETASRKVIAAVVCDLERSPIGTASRLACDLAGVPVLTRTLAALAQVAGIEGIYVLAPEPQLDRVRSLVPSATDIRPLAPRTGTLAARVRGARAWNLCGWRGGAGQWTVFDEDYHPQAIAELLKETAGGHVLCVPAHAAFLDPQLTAALVHHHLHKNHEMRLTYTPAAPGLSGIVLRADIAQEIGEKNVLPGQLLGYDPRTPTFDTLIREACMQVDPALSKIPNRFLLDTQRAWDSAEQLLGQSFDCAASLARAAAELRGQGLGYGVRGEALAAQPRELEIELTARRETMPPGAVPADLRAARPDLPAARWIDWLTRQHFADDLLLTFCGDGDPLLYPELPTVLAAARAAGPLSVHVQTDLTNDIAPLLTALAAGSIDVLSINFYGDDAPTYAAVAEVDLHASLMRNLERLAGAIDRGGLPLVVPRLLKVRQTIPQMEAFFDRWILNSGWAVMDYPTDRAGAVPFAGVVDMAPPKRRACRRLAERMLIRASGVAVACDQDVGDLTAAGAIAQHSLEELWKSSALCGLRGAHVAGRWNDLLPCRTCREWHRA